MDPPVGGSHANAACSYALTVKFTGERREKSLRPMRYLQKGSRVIWRMRITPMRTRSRANTCPQEPEGRLPLCSPPPPRSKEAMGSGARYLRRKATWVFGVQQRGERADGYDNKKAGSGRSRRDGATRRWCRHRTAPVPCRSRRQCGRVRSWSGARPGQAGSPTDDGIEPAAGFRPEWSAERLFLGPGRHRSRSVLQWPRTAERADSASVDWGAVGRGPGMER